jgi:hypothetical protein
MGRAEEAISGRDFLSRVFEWVEKADSSFYPE